MEGGVVGQPHDTPNFHPRPGTNFHGMTLPRTAWVRFNCLRTGIGRFQSCLPQWGMVSSAACEHSVEERIIQRPIHRPLDGLLTVLDDDTIEWLPNT